MTTNEEAYLEEKRAGVEKRLGINTRLYATTQTPQTPQTPTERRAASNPVLIGILTGFVGTWLAGVFAVRQRSWTLGLVAWLPILMWAFTEPDVEGGLRTQRKYAFQMASGVLTGAVALVKKKEAQEELGSS